MSEFLSFEEAVTLTRNLENYFNSDKSDNVLEFLRQRFNLTYRDGFVVKINQITKNHPKCSGCSNGQCVLGCYMSHNGNISYWDQALTKVLGVKLVIHEFGHVLHEQVFLQDLDAQSHFERSEEFAQYMENSFNRYMSFTNHSSTHFQTTEEPQEEGMSSMFSSGIIRGIALGLGFALATVLINKFKK